MADGFVGALAIACQFLILDSVELLVEVVVVDERKVTRQRLR